MVTPLNSVWKLEGVVTSNLGGSSGFLGFGETISVLASLTMSGGGVTALCMMIVLGFLPGLGLGLGFSLLMGKRSLSFAGLTSDRGELGDCLSLG